MFARVTCSGSPYLLLPSFLLLLFPRLVLFSMCDLNVLCFARVVCSNSPYSLFSSSSSSSFLLLVLLLCIFLRKPLRNEKVCEGRNARVSPSNRLWHLRFLLLLFLFVIFVPIKRRLWESIIIITCFIFILFLALLFIYLFILLFIYLFIYLFIFFICPCGLSFVHHHSSSIFFPILAFFITILLSPRLQCLASPPTHAAA